MSWTVCVQTEGHGEGTKGSVSDFTANETSNREETSVETVLSNQVVASPRAIAASADVTQQVGDICAPAGQR